MTPEGFSDYFHTTKQALDLFGAHVVKRVSAHVKAQLAPSDFANFFKVSPTHRVKDHESAIRKLIKKKYEDPVKQMTDLVGARFVVLLQSDLEIVERAVTADTNWSAQRDRNPIVEINETPEAFEYQSIHYTVRPRDDLTIDGISIPTTLICEIQIRTLVQHAYAEFVHDRVYKAEHPPLTVRRLVARAMAHLEATDEIFSQAANELKSTNLQISQWCLKSDQIYLMARDGGKTAQNNHSARLVFERFRLALIHANAVDVANIFLSKAPFIRELAHDGNLFSETFVAPVCWLIVHCDHELSAEWPLPNFRGDLETLAAQFGIAL